ncbi:MAG: DNA repair protein RecO [Chakrabartia sp.]
MQQDHQAIICALRAHGEHGVIARALTRDAGLVAGYVRGGRSRILRPVLMPGNMVMLSLKGRTTGQLPGMTVELIGSRAGLMEDPMAAAGMDWACALVAATLPEEQVYGEIFEALDGLLGVMEAAPSARRWAGAMLLFERLLMRALGYGGEAGSLADDWPQVLAGLNANGARLARHLLNERQRDILPARERMVDRFKRAVA